MPIRLYAGLPLDVWSVRAALVDRDRVARGVLDVRKFHLDGGAQVAICGPSRSGKTTLVHLLAGLVRPDRGMVRWGEIELTALSGSVTDLWRRETVGLVFPEAHLFPGMSAADNVLLPLRFDRWSIAPPLRGRALKLLERVGVRPDSAAGDLSPGEQQRVAIARALVRKPAIVLADEPTAGLDRESANAAADLLSSMFRSINATLVVTTHDPLQASRFDQVIALVEGDLRVPMPAPVVDAAIASHGSPDRADRRFASAA